MFPLLTRSSAAVVVPPRRRGRPNKDSSLKVSPNSRKKNFILDAEQLKELFETPHYPRTLISTLTGSMKIELHNYHYEFNCNRNGNHYYRCASFPTTTCGARVLDRSRKVYVINSEHNHSPPVVLNLPRIDPNGQKPGLLDQSVRIDDQPSAKQAIIPKPSGQPRLLNQMASKAMARAGGAKFDLKTQIANRLQKLPGFGDINN